MYLNVSHFVKNAKFLIEEIYLLLDIAKAIFLIEQKKDTFFLT
jgi:hypothetical protein